MLPNYYNEHDAYAAQWLRNLIAHGHIAPGDVDERSIEDVRPADLVGYVQCHFFAGIGIWSYALRRAGWPDDRPIWTGSCPCQPFSAAGEGKGFADERHLWPAFHWLIGQRRPAAVVGEQVASKDADPWIDLVCADLEALGYAFGASAFPAAAFGAPHIRDRLYWVAHAHDAERWPLRVDREDGRDWQDNRRQEAHRDLGTCGQVRQLGDAERARLEGHRRHGDLGHEPGRVAALAAGPAPAAGAAGRLADTDSGDPGQRRIAGSPQSPRLQPGSVADGRGLLGRMADAAERGPQAGQRDIGGAIGQGSGRSDAIGRGDSGRPGPVNGLWRAADWLFCRDGFWRPVEPGTFPLAHGAPARVGRLRAYGNGLNSAQAEEFLRIVMETRP